MSRRPPGWPTQLLLASNNAGKLGEFQLALQALDLEVIPQGRLAIPEAEEPFASFVENALAKARNAAHLSGLAALADDSGVCVDALGGAPGVLSARFAGEPRDDSRNNRHLLDQLEVVGALAPEQRTAHFVCTLVLLRHAADPDPLVAQGRWSGRIAQLPVGTGGFGYDPLFFVPSEGCTAAELTAERKIRLSHRGAALRQLLRALAPDAVA